MDKFFYLHIPKTGGSFFNKFLSSNFNNFLDHIESNININDPSEIEKLKELQSFSGHIIYPFFKNKIQKIMGEIKVITILRNPMEQLISHITYVRTLGEDSEKERLKKHSNIIKKLVSKLKKTDLSSPKEIENLIKWLENNKIWLFHDCQTRYLGGGVEHIKPINLNSAIENLKNISYVGITERLKEFMILLAIKENFKLIEYQKENVTKNRYGLDINREDIRKALQPLIQYDIILYKMARERFIRDLYNTLLEEEVMNSNFQMSFINYDFLFTKLMKNKIYDCIVRGAIDKIEEKFIQGWAIDCRNVMEAVDVYLYINNQLVMTTIAKNFRKDLKEKGIHPTGYCGFVFNLEKNNLKITPFDDIKVKVKNHEILKISDNALKFFIRNRGMKK